jgi:hypothetical protein
MTHHIPDGLFHEVWQLYEGGHSSDDILARLLKRDVNMDVAEAVLFKVKSMQDARKRRRGLRLVIAGGATLVSAFLITFLLHVAGVDTNIPLYGLTTIGIGMLFTGMIFYMG